MKHKDYYQLLGLEPPATALEIKKAYRKLAQQYHPDKTNNDRYAAGRFTEIKEAYETLIHPAKKEFYLQQRWYNQRRDPGKKQAVPTPVILLRHILELDKYVSQLDSHRMDKQGLYTYIVELIGDENIEKLNAFNDREINKEITQVILHCGGNLPMPLVISLHERLTRINNDPATGDKLNQYLRLHQKKHRWEKYRVGWLLLTAVLICLLIFFFSR